MNLLQRNRRLRITSSLREMLQENTLSPSNFMAPLFIIEGKNKVEEIVSMPSYSRYSIDKVLLEIDALWNVGIKSVLLFVKVDDTLKDNEGKEAYNDKGLMQQAIKAIKKHNPEMIVITDVALDPYSVYGHDGIVEQNYVMNDKTVDVLAKMALSHAQAGADLVAPSDMMDGRILAIRSILEKNEFVNTGILSYSAKYASCFYGPFRDALDSAPGFGDKKSYQMDYCNAKEALNEALKDINEGADIVMVKPGLAYLDIVRLLSDNINIPIASYQVSGEYAMIKAAAEKGWLDYDKAVLESLMAFKRAGAQLIATYFAKEASALLNRR